MPCRIRHIQCVVCRVTWKIVVGAVLTLIVLTVSAYVYVGVGPDYSPPHRPSGVPPNAVWAGGPDGGSYFVCGVDMVKGVNPCTVWNDRSGAVIVSDDFWISGQDRAATAGELRFGWYDGAVIGLQVVTADQKHLTLQSEGSFGLCRKHGQLLWSGVVGTVNHTSASVVASAVVLVDGRNRRSIELDEAWRMDGCSRHNHGRVARCVRVTDD